MSEFFSSIAESFTSNLPAQLIGLVGFVLIVISYQFNDTKKILFIQFFSGIFFTIQFFILGAYTGAIINIIGIIRAVIFYYNDKPWAKSKAWLFIIMAASVVSGILTWDGIFSIFPMLSFLFTSIALWNKRAFITRCFVLPGSICFLIYNFATLSYAGILTEILSSCSIISAFIRFDILKKKEN